MTTISSITAQSQSAQANGAALNQDFDDFLTLLTTQLQNQDPLEPQDTSEFTNQLVQFSQVEQQIETNDILDDLRALDVLRITELGLSFVGLDVEISGDTFEYNGVSDSVDLGYVLPESSTGTTISILDENGDSIFSVDGETDAGLHTLDWNGLNEFGFQAPAGTYTVEVSAQSPSGDTLNVQTSVPGRVDGIQSDGQGNILLLIGDLELPISDVSRARLPDGTDIDPVAALTEP